MDLEIILSEESHTVKDKHVISLTCEIQKGDINESMCRKETDSQSFKNLQLPKGSGR